ncbi:MAG: hypothetical protein J6Y14_00245 [Fibrobacter sp.]|nr:hypothetical protein [Fibrobacter sp.]
MAKEVIQLSKLKKRAFFLIYIKQQSANQGDSSPPLYTQKGLRGGSPFEMATPAQWPG